VKLEMGSHNHLTFIQMLTVASIVCISHAVIGLSAHFHSAQHKKSKAPGKKSGPSQLWWLRLVQLGFGLLCLFLVIHLSTGQERNWLCVWLVLMSLTPIVGGVLSFFGFQSARLVHALVILFSAAILIYYVMQNV